MSRSPHARRRPALAPATLSEMDGVRFLHLGTPWVQGAMRLRRPDRIELVYVQRMMAGLMWVAPEQWPHLRTLQLGLGASALTRFCAGPLGAQATAVEINPAVILANRQWFRLPPDHDRLRVIEADAGAFVAQAAQQGQWDVLGVDLYDHEAASPILDSAAFYAHCRQCLAPGGWMSVNVFGRDASFAQTWARLQAAFGAEAVWRLPPTAEGNTIVLATRDLSWPSDEDLARHCAQMHTQFKWPAVQWLRMLRNPGPLPVSADSP